MVNENEVLERLEKYLHDRFKNAKLKSEARILLQKKEWIDYIVKDVAKNDEEKSVIYDKYFDVYDKVEKYYRGYFIEEERNMKNAREIAIENEKIKRQDKLATHLIINKWLDDLNKKL